MEVRRARNAEQRSIAKSTWRRLLFALPLSVLVHIVVALVMRPKYRDVADFAVEFQVSEVTPGLPREGQPNPAPEPAPEPVPETEKPVAESKKRDLAPKVAAKDPGLPAPEKTSAPEPKGVRDGADAGVGSGICLHDLFAYTAKKPAWLLYVSMASFRGTVFQKEFGNTFKSFDLGRRLTRYMGMNPAEEVEAIFVASEDVFDWRAFRIVASYDSGEERLKGQMSNRLKHHPNFKWRAEDGGYVGMIPGEFRWQLLGSGRVFVIDSAPSPGNPAVGPAAAIPDNPFELDAGLPDGETGKDTASTPRKGWPKQVPCIDPTEKSTRPHIKSAKAAWDLETLSKAYLTSDEAGHYPVALLSTSDPRAVGIGNRLGAQLGFKHALFRGYFTDPVRIEGTLVFAGDEKRIALLAEAWSKDAKRFARDPILAVTGVSHLLKNLTIQANGTQIRVTLTLTERQVLSTLLFLQLQGKALERQLKAKQ